MRVKSLIFFMFLPVITVGQQGGSSVYSFLELDPSARIAATGGTLMALKDGDVKTALVNPSLLDSSMSGALTLNYMSYFAGINYLSAGYAHQFGEATWSVGLTYLNYGMFTRADEYGNVLGQFTANDMSIAFGASKPLDSLFTVGANVKLINSILESYTSAGIAVDLAATFHKKGKGLTASLVLRNLGTQLSNYYGDNKEPLPTRLDFGVSKKAAKAPFRLNLLLRDLQKWDLTYRDPNQRPQTDLNGNIIPIEEPGFGDKLMRHVGLALEFIPSESFYIDIGFNYRRRQELKLDNRPGMTGFSAGVGIKIKRFMFNYGRSTFHRAGASNHISITTNIGSR